MYKRKSSIKLASWMEVRVTKKSLVLLAVWPARGNLGQDLIGREKQEMAVKLAEVGFLVSS